MAATPDTIVLIHGFWVTPRSWEDWKARYESRGYRVLTPAYPGFEVEVEALNADPTPIEDLTVPAVVEHLESVVSPIEPAPILMGHSAGGVFTQLLMDRGYGAAGVAINSAPTEGVKRVPLSQIRSSFPVLKNPANRHKAVGFTFEQWRYVFTNTFSEEEARRLYERYHIPASGRVFWASALANIHPGPDDTHVDYKNPNRAPLLFIAGSEDHLMPPSIQRSNAKHYKAEGTITEVSRVRGPRAPHALPDRLGGDRRLRPRLGGRARTGTSHCVGNDDAVAVLRRAADRGPSPLPLGGPRPLLAVPKQSGGPAFDPSTYSIIARAMMRTSVSFGPLAGSGSFWSCQTARSWT